MTKQEKIDYWLKSAEKDWKVVGDLFEKQDYSYSLWWNQVSGYGI